MDKWDGLFDFRWIVNFASSEQLLLIVISVSLFGYFLLSTVYYVIRTSMKEYGYPEPKKKKRKSKNKEKQFLRVKELMQGASQKGGYLVFQFVLFCCGCVSIGFNCLGILLLLLSIHRIFVIVFIYVPLLYSMFYYVVVWLPNYYYLPSQRFRLITTIQEMSNIRK